MWVGRGVGNVDTNKATSRRIFKIGDGGALYFKFCLPTLCPNNGMVAVRSKFLQPPPSPPKKRGDVLLLLLLMSRFCIAIQSVSRELYTLVYANSFYKCKSLDRKKQSIHFKSVLSCAKFDQSDKRFCFCMMIQIFWIHTMHIVSCYPVSSRV